jgi:hypothetical protein
MRDGPRSTAALPSGLAPCAPTSRTPPPSPPPRAKYDPDEYRRGALLRLRRHLHEVLLDQLPCLKGLQRLLDEVSLGADTAPRGDRYGGGGGSGGGADQGGAVGAVARLCGGGGGGGGGSGRGGSGSGGGRGRVARLILEQMPQLREAIVQGRDWEALAARTARRLGEEAARLARGRAERMLKSFDFLCNLEDAGGAGDKGSVAAGPAGAGEGPSNARSSGGGAGAATVRIECWRRVRAGVHERWCEFELSLDAARAPEEVVVAGEGGAVVQGLRHRLMAMEVEATRPLPCDGKVGSRQGRAWAGAGHSEQLSKALSAVVKGIGGPLRATLGAAAVHVTAPRSPPPPRTPLPADCGALAGRQGRSAAAAAQCRGALACRHAARAVAHGGAVGE